MSMQNNIPNYADLFGNIDFKEGDDARSVYSPAAYLTDLLQMLDDEFDDDSVDENVKFDTRRGDIKDINLDAENTNTLIPYLDIVNEVLEDQVNGGYQTLKSAAYPFNMPFSLDNEKIKNHLHHLSISAHELRRLFATDTDYYTVAREYLGLSLEEVEALLEPETVTEDAVKGAYGYTNDSFIKDMSTVANFMETTDLTAQEMLQLLYQNLYIEPSNHSDVEAGRHNFYINTGISSSSGYVTLNTEKILYTEGTWLVYTEETAVDAGETAVVYTEETALVWYDYDSETDTQSDISTVPMEWFERTSRFVRLAQKTGLSFTDLDRILRHCCKVDGTPTLNEDTLVIIAQVVYLHKTLEQPIDKVVAVVSEIDFTGRTNEDLPQDQFNRIFNLPCVSVNEKYLHISDVMGEVPEQYDDTTYHTYTPIVYYPDLFSDDNDDYRKRLRHSLGFTDTDLINITNRLEYEEVADSSLWEETENEWQLLNVLYRIRALCDGLDVHFLELFTLFDLLEQDPFINRFDPHTYFVYNAPSTHKCFEIFMAGSGVQSQTDRVIVYQNQNYGGTSQEFVPGEYNISELYQGVGNDTISSLKVPKGWTVTLYQHANFQGKTKTFTADTQWVETDFNDITSCIVVKGSTSIISDQLWLFESLVVLTKWMKEFGYSPEMLWKIVNGAPMTDKEEVLQKEQDLALYNNLLQSFKAGKIRPNTLKEVLGDERASHFAFSLIKEHYGDKHEYKPKRCRKSSRFRKHMGPKEHKHLLLAYKPREIEELAHDFIQQLGTISDYEFIDLQLENKLIEKIFNHLVNHEIIDGSGKILTENLIDHQLPPIAEFEIEYDFSDFDRQVFELFYRIYQEAADARIEESDTIEVQVFKSDLKELGLTETEARELYDNLIYNGYIDSEGYAQDVSMFSDASGASSFDLNTELGELTHSVYHLLKRELSKFKASKVKISEQIFAELDLKPVALQDLIENLKMNRYIDEHMFVRDKMRIVGESPRTMALALQFYPHRQEILKALKDAIAADKDTWLKIDRVELSKIAATAVSRWVYEDLQDSYLDGKVLQPGAGAFFKEESNRENFSLRQYFDVSQTTIIFDHIVGIINYAENYRLKDENLADLDFKAEEIRGLKQVLEEINVIDDNSILLADWLPFFLVPENAATFSVPGFEDYDKEIFFQLYDIAKAIDDTVMAVDKAMKEHSDAQENGILEQLQSVLGIESSAVKAVSKAVFKTDNNLHFPWLQPLLENANALGSLDEIPDDMHYTQAVKRIRQLALLINKEQLDLNEIALLLEDQDLVAKFPEDMILPDDITSVDAILETEEFIYFFKDDYYWIYLAEDYTLIDKKEVVAGIDEDDDLIDLQKEDEELQKCLKEDPIRQLFDKEELIQVDATFIDRYGTWVVVSGDSHYVKYAHTDVWDKRSNQFGQVDNDFDNLEMIDAAYVDSEGRLFLFANDKYVRYSDVSFNLDYNLSENAVQSKVDWGYPKSIAEDWNDENLPIQLPKAFSRDLGPMFDGLDNYSYAFLGEEYISSEDGTVRPVAEKWGHREYNFGQADRIDAAMVNQEGDYLFFLDDKVVKYAGSIELANLQPEEGYPKPLHQEFTSLPDEFVVGIDAALNGEDGKIYLFRDDEFVSIDPNADNTTSEVQETRSKWGKVTNNIANQGEVNAAFVGLDGYTYMFSGEQYVRYSGSDYSQVDDGFPRNISEDWEGLTEVTGAFVLDNRTYLFGKNNENTNIYVRYSTLSKDEEDYLEVDEEDPNARVIETVLANRPDVYEIEVFPATVNEEFWSLPESITGGATEFQIDAVMNGPHGKVYLFYGDHYIEHDYANRWWSEPKILSEQWNRTITGLDEGDRIVAAFTGKDSKTYLFYNSKYLRFSDPELRRLDYGYPRPTKKFWGKVHNNIDKTGKVDAALMVESRWEEQDDNGQLVDMTAMHTYLFSGNQIFRYEGSNYDTVEPGYPRSTNRLHEEPRFRGLQIGFGNEHRDYSSGKQRHRKLPFKGLHASFPEGIDAAFADQRQVYLFKGNSFHVVIGDEDNYKQYPADTDTETNIFGDIQAVTQEKGVSYVLRSSDDTWTWQKLNHLEALTITQTEATPRTAEKAAGKLTDDNEGEIPIDAILHGTDGKSYVFAGSQYYDVDLERSFAIEDVWGRSWNPIHDRETIDAAFVGRDGVTYVFSGEWFVQYDGNTYVEQTVTYPPRRIRDKWLGLDNVALAYVWKEETYLFERPKGDGTFRYLRYSKDSYERPDPGYPRQGDYSQWNIPEEHQREGFDNIDTIFVQNDNLIFISDQKFISFNLNTENWSYPQPLELIYSGIPFNKTDFQDLKSGFIGADGTAYFFNQQCYVSYDSTNDWSNVSYIKDHWGLQENIFSNGVSAAWVSGDGVTYLFAGNSYVRYSGTDYRYVDEAYPKEIATYLRSEPAFEFMSKEFQQHLDELEETYNPSTTSFDFFNGLLDNGRCLYFFTSDTLFTGCPNRYVAYEIDGIGQIENNFTQGGYVDAAFVDNDNQKTYLFSGEQYIRYTGDRYRYIDEGYPKIIAESLAEDLGINSLGEDYRNGIDAAFYHDNLGLVLFNEQKYLNVTDDGTNNSSIEGDVNVVWGQLDNAFTSSDSTIDGAYVDNHGALYVFKDEQFVRYSDTAELFDLNRYDEPRYVDEEYPRKIEEIWPQLDSSILTTNAGVGTVFKFEDHIYFHTEDNFVTYNLDLTDQYEQKPVQLLAYRWGEWSDYLLSDVHNISRFKDLGQRFSGGELTLTELVSGANGKMKEPYMHFAAIFGFEKEEVRWVKQRNAFLPGEVNAIEEYFDLELVLRLYDILATTQRLRVDVSALYNDVWLPLYDPNYWSEEKPDVVTAATGAYDLLVSVDCDNNYETLVTQITNELNTIKRDALVPYVIANDSDVTTTRQLYQKLLIDIQMDSSAETSRIKEASAAIQLYLHRYFLNLEDIDLNASDQEATRLELKERWEWLRNYRVWEANRKVFLYPENYIRPELRDRDMKTSGFKALEASLSQGQLTESSIEEAYLEYLDSFTEVSQLKIAGGYVYEDSSSETGDQKLVLFGHTRTDPMRYFYRFATFVGGDSAAAIWEPWNELEIKIEATRVEPVFAFNRVFVFWAVLEEILEDPSSTLVDTSSEEVEVSSQESTKQINVYYSFYNLNKRWTQPQALQTTFDDVSYLTSNQSISDVNIFVENSTKLTQNSTEHDDYENIYIRLRYKEGSSETDKAFNLTSELYSQVANTQTIENRGQELFNELFEEGDIEEDNVVMLNNSSNSIDGPWFAYNHKGCGFLVKPDAISLDSDTSLTTVDEKFPGFSSLEGKTITAAVQVYDRGDIYYFLSDKTYVKVSADGTFLEKSDINNRWGIPDDTSDMQITGHVDSAYVISDQIYLTLDGDIYEYTGSFSTLVTSSYEATNLPDGWSRIDAAFTNKNSVSSLFDNVSFTNENSVNFWFNNDLGLVYDSDSKTTKSIRTIFGLPEGETGLFSSLSAAGVFNDKLHLIDNGNYTVYALGESGSQQTDTKVQTVLNIMLEGVTQQTIELPEDRVNDTVIAIMVIDGDGLWIKSSSENYIVEQNTLQNSVPSPFDENVDDQNWTSGLNYTDTNGNSYYLAFYDTHRGITTNNSIAKAWSKDVNGSNYQVIDFGNDSNLWISTLYNTGVNVTGAFTTAGGYIAIVTDKTTYHLFDNSLQPKEILTKLSDDTYSGNLSDLNLPVYLNTTFNNVWLDNKVDAAFIGTGVNGTQDALYLFCGNQYLCFTQENGSFSSSADYSETLNTNTEGFPQWSQIDATFTSPSDGISYFFNNTEQVYYKSDTSETNTTVGVWGVLPVTTLQTEQQVDAAYVFGDYLYLIVNTDNNGTEYYRYTLESSANNGVLDTVPDYIDHNPPQTYADTNSNIDAAFVINNYVYLFSGTEYYRLEGNDTLELGSASPILGSWGNLPEEIRNPEENNPSALSAALNHVYVNDDETIETLYLIKGDAYIKYEISDDEQAQPYEIKDVNYELIRLTSSTAEQLNQLLFANGIDELLKLSTQEINESPTLTKDGDSTPYNIKMSDKFSTEPTNSHLDFNSANGIYYWEVFFHAPFLIAQTLNTEQQFEYAKEWYEYIFDPTEISDYWKFLPFLAADPDALMTSLSYNMDAFITLFNEETVEVTQINDVSVSDVQSTVSNASDVVESMADVLAPFQEVFLGLVNQDLYEESSGKYLATIESWDEFSELNTVISNLSLYLSQGNITASTSDSELLNTWVSEMQEVMEILKKLDFRIDLMSNYNAQLTVYLEDPFDPHAIAALRPLAYRKAIVMRYIDNLLDWGDMLFRQYTRESINEARMLYILAYDLLGEKPENMGRVVLEPTQSYNGLYTDEDGNQLEPSDAYDFLIDLENSTTDSITVDSEQSLSFAATQFDTITRPYFFIKENELFTEYWTRVEDRLGKIRASLNIDGVAQPLPLFQPPIDPMALVNAAASGGGITAATMAAAGAASVPDYRFSSMMAKARDLVGKLKSFSDNLLSVLEKKDSEELSLMQNKQSAMILDIVTSLKKEQIKEAKESLANLKETKNRAEDQKDHYQNLISDGYLREEQYQLDMMLSAAIMHQVISLGKIFSGLSYVVPQFTIGAFSFGATAGGKNVGDMSTRFGDAIQSTAEGLSMFGEMSGVAAQFKRSKQDWELQRDMAASEIIQLDYQIKAQEHRVKMSEIELLQHEKDIENNEVITKFMKSKFSNMQLYSWMSSKISGLFFQTYKLAHDYAKKAEQAFIFEKGIKAGEVNYINGMYWENQYQGLLSGSTLELDLDRMEKAYAEMDSRRLEITKNISLLEMDPLALLQLKTKGSCTFRLSEELFDYDFPGHYNRQIKAISLAFNVGEGQKVNATLTQLSSKLVMDTDIKAVKHLIDPANEATANVRANWRANQQVALSHVDQYTENSGMFELNFGDERYLPFEGTGAVSNWNLEINGKKGDYNPNDLLDVTIKLRYTAKQGGSRFANEVKGVLKPYNATSFFDLAYNFSDEWAALTEGETNDVSITLTQDMFPNMSSSRIIGLFIRYEYKNGQGGAIFTINDDLQVPNNTYLQPTTLSVGQRGSEWNFTVKGDASSLQNAEMVLVYKAKV